MATNHLFVIRDTTEQFDDVKDCHCGLDPQPMDAGSSPA